MGKEKVNQYLYFIVVFVISIVMLLFLPMVGSHVEGKFAWPSTGMEWFIFSMTKIVTAVCNVMILYCFLKQAEVNVKDNEKYKKANEILSRTKKKEYVPMSPAAWKAKKYTKKSITIAVMTISSVWAFTEAILTFDVMLMLTYLFTVIMGVVFGVVQMKSAEIYWTQEFYDYAIMKENEDVREQQHSVSESTGTSREEQG